MKKFISMVMAAAMVVSLVPATAFAADEATFKVVGDEEYTDEYADAQLKDDATWWVSKALPTAEIQLKVKDVDTRKDVNEKWDLTLSFDNLEAGADVTAGKEIELDVESGDTDDDKKVTLKLDNDVEKEDDSFDFVLSEKTGNLEEGDIIVIDLAELSQAKFNMGLKLYVPDSKDVTVTVDSDFGASDEMTLLSILDEGLDVTLKKVAEVAEEEETNLESDLTIETAVGYFAKNQKIEVKLNSGFEWTDIPEATEDYTFEMDDDDDTFVITVLKDNVSEIKIDKDDVKIDAAEAKVGDIAKITVKAKDNVTGAFKDTVVVDAAEVIAEEVVMSVEEDEDLPVIYSGVNVNNYGITDDSDHLSLEVTLEESVFDALDVKKDFTLTLTEGVFVTGIEVNTEDNVLLNEEKAEGIEDAFEKAYKEGDQKCFEFDRKTFESTADVEKEMELAFELELIAVPGFEGDVELTLDGAAFDEPQTVKIATFVSPYTVEASQNDLIIDYRNTEVPTDIVVKEAEAGLWAKDEMVFEFAFDHDIEFEDDAVYAVNTESDMEISDKGDLGFVVDEESDDEAAVVTISDISLYMGRSLAAGAYDLELGTSAGVAMMTGYEATKDEVDVDSAALLTAEKGEDDENYFAADFAEWDYDDKDDKWEAEKATVKEGFVNIVTAGRDADDASFTTKVVVPVGESYIVAGEQTVALDVPAYVSASGYTMLPVRAVAVALGILNNNVLWDQASKTVTILYGQRIITMTVGAKVINVNGSAIPASSSPEVVDGRTFLPMRDLATALGVTDITWDAATKTATLNGNK